LSDAPPPIRQVAAVTLVTTLGAAGLSYTLPDAYAGTAVAALFLGVTWWTVLRRPAASIRAYGLSLGGLMEPGALDVRHLLRSAAIACGWAGLCAGVVSPPCFFVFRWWWHTTAQPVWALPDGIVDLALGQLFVVALPEEAFFRGYLQSALERHWPKGSRKVLAAQVGLGWLVASLVFAVGHMLTIVHPSRLAVFFPALLFGWLRARTGGVGAGIVFHALCNLLTLVLAESFGLR
jgi:membrane protease YdiL (CAAX protease family)